MATHSTDGASGISPERRDLLAALADEMIPASPGMPSATESGVHRSGVDAVLRSRPDLGGPLRQALDELAAALEQTSGSGSALATIRSAGHEASWGVLGSVVGAAYFLNPEVREALGYPGQESLPVDEQPDDLDQGLLAEVRMRPPVYRPTPPG
jgi:hypothetical protein